MGLNPMKHVYRAFGLALIICVLVRVTHAQTLVAFNFNDQSNQTATLTASTLASNVTANIFSVSDGGFTSTNFTTSSPPDSPAVSDSGSWVAATPTKYFAFTVTPSSGYSVVITNISFDYRQTASGALIYQVNIGQNANLASGSFTTDSAWHLVSQSITLSALTNANEVRIYGYGNGSGGSGSFSIDRVILTGTVSAIPEPATYAAIFGAVALVSAGWHCRRQKQKSSATLTT